MKPVRYTILALLLCPALSAHGADNVPDAARTVSERVVEPSPDVATARRYADFPVSYATGSASVSLPLMTLSTPTLSVSLGLDYRCEAKRVDEPAGWVGLGWTLTGLGSVSRQICGMPDDWHLSPLDFRPYSKDPKYYNSLLNGTKDANPDRYTLVTPDGECVHFIAFEDSISILGFTDISIERKPNPGNKLKTDMFIATTPRGVRYEYAEKESMQYYYDSEPRGAQTHNVYYTAVTSWHLTKIVAPEQSETITLEYSSGTPWAKHVGQKLYSMGYYWRGKGSAHQLTDYHGNDNLYEQPYSGASGAGRVPSTANTSYISPPLPRKISCPVGTIEFDFEYDGIGEANENGSADRLKGLTLRSPSGEIVRSVSFVTSSSGAGRRLLDKVAIDGPEGVLDGYSFDYESEFKCYGDIFGYPNLRSNDIYGNSILDEDLNIRASRKTHLGSLSNGLLLSMSTASGTTTRFEYEPSIAHLRGKRFMWDEVMAAGTRIKSITVIDEESERWRRREFEYSGDTMNMDIRYYEISNFLAPSGECEKSMLPGMYCEFKINTVFTSYPRNAGRPIGSTRVYYDTVDEILSGSDITYPVKTRYEYDLGQCLSKTVPCGSANPPDFINPEVDVSNPFLRQKGTYQDLAKQKKYQQIFRMQLLTTIFKENFGAEPLLKAKTTYGVANGTYIPKSREEYEYEVSSRMDVPIGLYYETVIYRINGAGGEPGTRYDIDNIDYVSHGAIRADCSRALCTEVRKTNFYDDGKSRQTSTSFLYEWSEKSHPGHFGDSLAVDTNFFRTLPLCVTYKCGADSVSRYDLYSGDIDRTYFQDMPDRYLPVAQKWIAAEGGRRDSLETAWLYGKFHGMTRAVRETVSRHGSVLDMAAYTAYDALGLPTAMTRRDGSEYAMTWDGYGNLTSRMLVGPGLESRYTYKPLVGCTSITYPSGRRKYFSYDNGRLSQVRNSANEPVASYGYTMANPGLNWGAQGENAVTTTAYTAAGKAVTKAVYDGFGMKTADIAEGFGGGGVDVVTATEYDALDRAVKLWQPAPGDTTAAAGFYGDTRPWTDYVYDTDGSQNIVSSTAPGKDMLDHAATNEYLCNTQSGELRCRHFVLEGDRLVDKGAYADAALDVVRATDADGHRVLTFTDWRGRTVLVRKVLSDSKYIDTHTLYDAWGDVLLVLQPEGVAAMQAGGSWDVSDGSMDDVIEKYAYVYRYDEALRPVYAKLPGCDPVTTAYDPDGLAAYTVDGNLRAKGRARFTLYDAAARPVVTGICDEPSGEVPRMRAAFDTSLAGLNKTGYTTDAPLTGMQVYTATYYDNYDFVSLPPFAAIPAVQMPTATAAAGLVTATLDRVLEGTLDPRRAKYVATVNTYDAEERPIKTVTAYHDTDICAVSENSYNIDGTVSTCTNTLLHPYDGHNDSHVYTYDAAGRLLKETASYDGGEPVTVQQLSYNAVGQLASNDLGAFAEAYTYNVRGAMTGRKSDVFEQTISFSNHFDRLYNGSIGMITDKLTGGKSTTSGYSYDNAGRLTSAMIFLDGKTRPTGYTYDLNGNITALNRLGYNPPSLAERIDDLVYQYDGNKVRKITEKAPVVISEKTMNFVDGADEEIEYTYDRNGNMTSDANRGMDMKWDANNRLSKVENDVMTMSFGRTGSGTKLSKNVYTGPKLNPTYPGLRRSNSLGGYPFFPRDSVPVFPGDSVISVYNATLTEYFGAYEYVNGRFSRLNTPTGYRDSVGTHVYVRDWQGNIRAVVRRNAQGVVELEQATYYYPYGMPMAESTNPTANRYKYTGKELLTDHGVNILDYGARFYDPTTCRWWSTDPKQENYKSFSSYCFNQGDPVNYFDPNGKFSKEWMASLSQTIYNSTHSNQAGPILVNETVENGCLMFTYQTTDIENGEFAVTLHTKFDKSIATGIQDVGDGAALAGYALTLSGVGAEVGVPLAYLGNTVSEIGSVLEFGIDVLNMDWSNFESGKADAIKSGLSLLIQKLIEKYLEKLLPGAKKTVNCTDYNYGDTVLKQGVDLKVSVADRMASAVVDHKQNESNDETPTQTTEDEQNK